MENSSLILMGAFSLNMLKRHIDALGVRYGVISEQAFKEGLRGVIEGEFGFRVEKKWIKRNEEDFYSAIQAL
ncbi:MAG: DUF3782 domain-containing protein [Candidatus Bathyarchaeia archaeon]